MVQEQGIDVYIAPFGAIDKRYQQYTVPTTSFGFTGNPNEVYIEAVDGERFVVVMDLLKDFDKGGSTRLHVEYEVDQNCGSNAVSQSLPYQTLRKFRPRESDLKGRDITDRVTRKVNGDWVECGYSFALLQMDEELEMTADEVARDVEIHGKIVVTVKRGTTVPMARIKHDAPLKLWTGYDPPDTEVSSKKVVQDNRVSHAVKHTILGKGQQPSSEEDGGGHKFKPLTEGMGEPVKFTIRYRSRDVLQKLHMIPKDKAFVDLTASPPTSPRVKLESGIKLEDIKNEADVTNVKREPGSSEVKTDIGAVPDRPFMRPVPDCAIMEPPPGMEPVNPINAATRERNRKRKAMQDELKAVELEQKRMRLEKALADIDNEE